MLENENMIDLLGSLKEMSSEQLAWLIQEETSKESPNDDLVLMALDILEDREKKNPLELGPKGKAAWKKYQSKVRYRERKTVLLWKSVVQVASVLLIITMLFALLPTQANAETWWERLARWTDDFFSFLSPNTSKVLEDEYTFQTDNEGLEQVYDAVKEFEITEPVVPMWLPEEYILNDLRKDALPNQKIIMASFRSAENEIILSIKELYGEVYLQYFKDDTEVKEYEKFGTTYNLLRNSDCWIITWAKDNIECSIFIDCQEDTLYKIIESIYRWRSVE